MHFMIMLQGWATAVMRNMKDKTFYNHDYRDEQTTALTENMNANGKYTI